ncbi:MAG: tetratricopeptide repeat protein [Acidobacteria bacterium]|nr:tetratricopeptide repeat protein [Acidobacteriota bacterium]
MVRIAGTKTVALGATAVFLGIALLFGLQKEPFWKPAAPSIPWGKDFQKALERARMEKKTVVADLFTDWCVVCKRMDSETFTDPVLVKQVADRYVWVKLNAEKEPDGIRLQKDFAIVSYPTFLLLDEKGEEIDRLDGFISAQEFKDAIESRLNNPNRFQSVRRRALQNPDNLEAQYAYAETLLNRQDYKQAATQFKSIIEKDPENTSGKTDLSYYYLALSKAALEESQEALRLLAEMASLFPKSDAISDVAVLRGQIYYYAGEHQKARSAFLRFLDDYPEHSQREEVRQLLAEIDSATSPSLVSSH